MKRASEGSLKAGNFRWLVGIAAADAAILTLFAAPSLIGSTTATQLGVLRAMAALFLPIFVLLVVNLIPHGTKASLVFWKLRDALPGAEAFTRYGPGDPRVDMARLKKHVGAFPSEPKEQNTKWYRLYKLVQVRVEVISAQRDFLLYRDAAAMSLVLMPLGPIVMYFAVGSLAASVTGALFAAQYLVTCLSARHAGVRFVCTVLALNSTEKIESRVPKAPAS